MTTTTLSCGHEPSPHSEHTTGTAHTACKCVGTGKGTHRPDCESREICWSCADALQREELKSARTFTAYLVKISTPGIRPVLSKVAYEAQSITTFTPTHELQTWSGGNLANVTSLATVRNGGFCPGTRITFRAIDIHGQRWYGTSPGFGMNARMRRAKG